MARIQRGGKTRNIERMCKGRGHQPHLALLAPALVFTHPFSACIHHLPFIDDQSHAPRSLCEHLSEKIILSFCSLMIKRILSSSVRCCPPPGTKKDTSTQAIQLTCFPLRRMFASARSFPGLVVSFVPVARFGGGAALVCNMLGFLTRQMKGPLVEM